ncbi:EamA-like transporter family protein [compost metagenome]
MLLYYKGLNTTKASFATLAELSFPMTGIIINWVVYQQLVTLPQIVGFALIWTALFFISNQQSRETAKL